MPTIDPTEVICYASAHMPVDDASTSGGAINPKVRVVFNDIVVASTLVVWSTSASESSTITIAGRDLAGYWVDGQATFSGTSFLSFSQTNYSHVLRVELDADAIGYITIQTNEAIPHVLGVIPPGERGFTTLFYKANGDPLSDRVRYEKVFWKNTNSTNQLHGMVLTLENDSRGIVAQATATTLNDSGSVVDRFTAPAGLTFTSDPRNPPVPYLTPGSAIGIWFRQTIPAGTDGFTESFLSLIQGHVE